MRKVRIFNLITLDGFFEGPNHEIDWHNVDDEFNQLALDNNVAVDTLLFGRVTFELMARYWPTLDAIKNDPVTARFMNEISKIVFSRTMQKADWQNTRLVKSNSSEEVLKLKKQPGRDVMIFGSSDLAVSLLQDHLIDEFQFLVNPLLIGKGKSIFRGIPDRFRLKLVDHRAFHSGNVLLTYQPA